MKNLIKEWLSQNKICVDNLGKVVINDVRIAAAINKMANKFPPDIIKGMCDRV